MTDPTRLSPALVLDSVTHLDAAARGRVALCASHGGVYAAYVAAAAGVSAVILNDAGIGRARAGVCGLPWLDALGVPAATVSHRSARIGWGADMATRGVLSVVNAAAAARGLAPGMACGEAAAILARAGLPPAPTPPEVAEARHDLGAIEGLAVVALDSNGLVTPADAGRIMITGSHGGLLGGRPQTAVKHDVAVAVYNDADRGLDEAGVSRLPALDARGIAGACVSAFSARIGVALSTWEEGVISALNGTAAAFGGEVGQSTIEFVTTVAAGRARERRSG